MNLSSPAAVSDLLRRHRFLPAHRLGQNFLVDANILRKITDAAGLAAGDYVIEIGTGLGVLTQSLAAAVGPSGVVTTIERDRRLAPLLDETIPQSQYPQVRRLEADVLDLDLNITCSDSAPRPGGVAVVANIPYNITSPLIAALLEVHAPVRVIVLLVQKEVGARLTAQPATPQYGSFSVFTQFHAEVDIVGFVSPSVFFPAPKVASAIVRLRPRLEPPVSVSDEALFFRIVHAAFEQRRKTLLNALSTDRLGWGKARAAEVTRAAGIDPMRRGETLSLTEFAAIERVAQ